MTNMANRSIRALKGGVAVLVFLMLGVALSMLINTVVPAENRDMVSMVVGGLLAKATTIVDHLFPTNPVHTRADAP